MQYQEIINRLKVVYEPSEAVALARLVLAERFGLTLTDIVCGKVNEFSRNDNETLEKIIVRLENNEPIQYVLGYQEFCGHLFHVEPGVLIPRPETEELVQAIVGCDGSGRILDIGTGSGCIAISLALAIPDADIEAWDISDDALRIAADNAERLSAKVTFNKVDVLTYAPHAKQQQCSPVVQANSRYSIIVSNPPYICHSEAADMERNVLDHEPHLALFVPDDDPLLFYRRIATLGTDLLEQNGQLWFEINRAYGKEVCAMMQELGYTDVRLINDQFDNPRIVTGRRQ